VIAAVNESASAWPNGMPGGLPRLLPPRPEGLRGHLARFGPVPYLGRPGALIADVQAAGLTGRGGAAFPAHRKLAVVASARGPKVVVANGAESEPASRKDETLLHVAPNLVLDGLQLAAEAVGASQAYLYLHQGTGSGIRQALHERAASRQDWLEVTIADTPPRFLAGQESAVVNRLGGGPAIPVFTPPRVTERGLGGRPTLVQNVETLAHLALIARYGPRWFRALGTQEEPGSMITTCYPASGGCRVIETAIGTPLAALLGPDEEAQAWLVGGYHGSWLPAPDTGLTLDNSSLRGLGAAVGAGVLAALPADRCGVAETARVVSYLAAESAGQCGPCLNGLPRIAATLAELAGPWPRRNARGDVERWAGLVNRRGACSHPDGTVRFVRSALRVFEPEFRLHERGHCSAASRRPFLPLPNGIPTSEDDWA
jgi:NADH:ubiquinone oxidoreductase subunit F (NADH-binding)